MSRRETKEKKGAKKSFRASLAEALPRKKMEDGEEERQSRERDLYLMVVDEGEGSLR